MSLRIAVDALISELTYGERSRCADLVDQVVAQLPDPIEVADEDTVRQALRALRQWRCFAPLGTLAEAIKTDQGSPFDVERKQFWVQALIDQQRLSNASTLLEELRPVAERSDPETRSEIFGLLGRLHKERFLKHGGEPSDLDAALGFHREVYDLDPSWHGANLVALTAYAERAGLAVSGDQTAQQWAERLLTRLNRRERERWDPWYWAAAGEAQLGIPGAEPAAATCFARYWWASDSRFALAGTARQLEEVWLVNNQESEEFISALMTQLKARYLSMAGASLTFTPAELIEMAREAREDAESGEAEALFGPGAAIPLRRIRKLLSMSAAVCRIKEPDVEGRGGTGFLVDGAQLHPDLAGQKLVLTNHHVLPHGDTSYTGSVRLDRAVAEFQFWGQQEPKEFHFDTILHSSPRDELDLSIATLAEPLGDAVESLPLSTHATPFRHYNTAAPEQRDQVFVVGHPGGRELSFSFNDNEVVDHELSDKADPDDGLRRIHYRTPTEPGSSGSPVFHHEDLEVVGLHRTGTADPLRDPWPGKAQGQVPYRANEAISIASIREFLAQAVTR